jgi:hypothetical protein
MFHETLVNHYQSNFNLMYHHKFSLTELENMLPWERIVYVTMLNAYIEEQNDKAKQKSMR